MNKQDCVMFRPVYCVNCKYVSSNNDPGEMVLILSVNKFFFNKHFLYRHFAGMSDSLWVGEFVGR